MTAPCELTAAQIRRKAYYEANKEKIKARSAKRYEAKREQLIAYSTAYARAHPERTAAAKRASRDRTREKNRERDDAYRRAYYSANRERLLAICKGHHYANHTVRLEQKRAWSATNPERGATYAAKRRAAKLLATPAWAEVFFIEEAYRLAALRSRVTGMPWEVDHIVPLVSESVCGLHVIDNLRVIPKTLNRSKSNRYWPDMAPQ